MIENRFDVPYSAIEFYKNGEGIRVELGRGGYSIVYKAKLENRDVAVKEIIGTASKETIEVFSRETDIHSKLNHKNIVKLYRICFQPLCMVLEITAHGSLFDFLQNNQGLSWAMRLSLVNDIALGMEYLHHSDIMHRDLKSPNILVDGQGGRICAKISDFGLSKVMEARGTITIAHAGSIYWMAPELFDPRLVGGDRDKPKCSYASDIYALGVVFWEIASQKILFNAINPMAVPVKVISGQRPGEIPQDTPRELAELIENCWKQKARNRLQASAVSALLNAFTFNPIIEFAVPIDRSQKSILQIILEAIQHANYSHLDLSALRRNFIAPDAEGNERIYYALRKNKIITEITWPSGNYPREIEIVLAQNKAYQNIVSAVIEMIENNKNRGFLSFIANNIDGLEKVSEFDLREYERICDALSESSICNIVWPTYNHDEFGAILEVNKGKPSVPILGQIWRQPPHPRPIRREVEIDRVPSQSCCSRWGMYAAVGVAVLGAGLSYLAMIAPGSK